MALIKWSGPARRDLARIDDHYRSIDPEFADQSSDAVVEAARFLLANPRVGAPLDQLPFRKWPVRTTPFILFYRVEKADIRIVRVRHNREDWHPVK
ncbi:MAG: type II toxin-antitoxin system RelE/ParE family toxin [Sphingopyxis sp.]|uniref:type II toxin-antitoxin system RelE/ParE family toxin n=1 Tax=Sphingopyxis sp. TaxID=1908224 RepID=UPI003D812551